MLLSVITKFSSYQFIKSKTNKIMRVWHRPSISSLFVDNTAGGTCPNVSETGIIVNPGNSKDGKKTKNGTTGDVSS
jgi:hypothetical protein